MHTVYVWRLDSDSIHQVQHEQRYIKYRGCCWLLLCGVHIVWAMMVTMNTWELGISPLIRHYPFYNLLFYTVSIVFNVSPFLMLHSNLYFLCFFLSVMHIE